MCSLVVLSLLTIESCQWLRNCSTTRSSRTREKEGIISNDYGHIPSKCFLKWRDAKTDGFRSLRILPSLHSCEEAPIYASGTGLGNRGLANVQEYWERKPLHFRAAERGSSLAALCFRSFKCSGCMFFLSFAGLL